MKNVLITILLVCTYCQLNAQESRQDYMVVPVISQQSFYLKGSTGKTDREILEINLPANTVEWYYTVTTRSDNDHFPNTDLTGQLVKLVDPDHGVKPMASAQVPDGTGVCDVYLMTNPREAKQYVKKRPAAAFMMKDSREHCISGAVTIKDFVEGSCFLVVRNPGSSRGVFVNIEVAAIVLSSAVGSSTAMQ